MLLSGCVGGQAKKVASQQTAPLPIIDLRATVTVLDAETGEPIPDAWVLIVARVTTDRPAPSGHLEAAAGARGVTGPQGTASIQRVEGTYYPGEPKGKAWHVMELSRTERLGPMKLTGIQGGSLVIASAKYGFVHQPFVVEDDPSYQDWLQKNRREDYNGWLGRDTMRKQLPLLSVRTKDIKEGVPLTIKMRRPAGLDEWANMISPVVFWNSTWVGMAKDAGAGEDEQRRIYWLFARQLDQIGLMSGKMEHVESFAVYLREEAIKLYVGHRPRDQDTEGKTQLWLARKALEVLPPDAAEVKEYVGAILKGVEEEGRGPRWQYHYLNPNDTAVGLPGFDSVLRWAGLDQDNAKNEWDWQDAQRYYRAGDRQKAYTALGHVLRLLTNLAIPKYTAADHRPRTAFEEAVESALAANGGSLPPDYWHSVREPAFALTPGVRFQAVAGGERKAGQGTLEVSGAAAMSDALNDVGGANQSLAMAKNTFPHAIAQGAGLLSDFHRLMHPAAHVQLPGNGNGNGGPQGVQQSSGTNSGSATDAGRGSERVRKATSGGETLPDRTWLKTAGSPSDFSDTQSQPPTPRPATSNATPQEKADSILKELRESNLRKPVEPILTAPDGPGVKAVLEILRKPDITPDVLMEIQKIGCSDEKENIAILVCQNTRQQLINHWKSKAKDDEELFLNHFAPAFLDKSIPVPARRDFAQRVVAKVSGGHGGANWLIAEDVRKELARSLASLVYESDGELQWQGLRGCLMLGKDVQDVEDAVLFALKSEVSERRYKAFYLFSTGATSEIQSERGLKGVLNGKAKNRLLDFFLSSLAEGSEKRDERIVGTGLRSAGHLAHPLVKAVADEIPRVISLLGDSLRDSSPAVRYQAYCALDYIATFGVDAMKARAKTAMGDFDPREDEIKSLGGPGQFREWKPNERK